MVSISFTSRISFDSFLFSFSSFITFKDAGGMIGEIESAADGDSIAFNTTSDKRIKKIQRDFEGD